MLFSAICLDHQGLLEPSHAGIHLFKVINVIFGVCIVNFENIWHIVLLLPLLTLNK